MDIDPTPANDRAKSSEARITYNFFQRMQDSSRPPPDISALSLDMNSFRKAFLKIVPSSKREGFATVPDTTWADIGALEDVRKELNDAIVRPIKMPEVYKDFGIKAPTGVLLWGPPGCGKTLLAKAVANESKANFISVKGPELFNKYLGESERAVRQLFNRARSSVPCVLFFDEFDALVPNRDSGSGNEASSRVVNMLLTELDGLVGREGIYVIAATNRPDIIDPAMLRPGRLEKIISIGLPKPEERVTILRTLLSQTKIDQSLSHFASRDDCANFSGADLAALLRQAVHGAIERESRIVELPDFEKAIQMVNPSVKDSAVYERMKRKLSKNAG
ncbi:AAA-domain-containing protein [Microthyrium microscopicum]|uniref:AAA-domain-containing protein n=1 Tax=Microthyrium microscopicum TaxID=703497 RepID=A0A6A6UL93_9PEZI|nr:AAA-domain-containing protein [Microthyrium microscopicum]